MVNPSKLRVSIGGLGAKRKMAIKMKRLRCHRNVPNRKNNQQCTENSIHMPPNINLPNISDNTHTVHINDMPPQINLPGITHSNHTVEIHINAKVLSDELKSEMNPSKVTKNVTSDTGRPNHEHSESCDLDEIHICEPNDIEIMGSDMHSGKPNTIDSKVPNIVNIHVEMFMDEIHKRRVK